MLIFKKGLSSGFWFAIPAIALLVLECLWLSLQLIVTAFAPNAGLEGLGIVYVHYSWE